MVVVSPAAAKGKEKRTNVRGGFCRKHNIQMIIYTPTHAPVLSTFANLWCFFLFCFLKNRIVSLLPMLHCLHGGGYEWRSHQKENSRNRTEPDLLPCQMLCVAGLYLMYIKSQTVTLQVPRGAGSGFYASVPEMKRDESWKRQ